MSGSTSSTTGEPADLALSIAFLISCLHESLISFNALYNFSSLFSLTKNYIRICAHWETINNVHGVYHGMV